MSLPAAMPPLHASASWPFVARGEQLEELVATLVGGEVDISHLTGPSGVGKTRLATALLGWAESDGFPVARARASRGTATVPLAPLASLLPASVLARPPELLVPAAVEHVKALADGSRLVVLVDDVDLLDQGSLAVLSALVEERLVHLVTTARDDVTTPELLLDALRHGRLRRSTVLPLTRLNTGTLLHLALQGPISTPLEQALWELSGGSPLYLRELVHASRESGAVRLVDGVWTLAATITLTSGLRDLVVERFGDLGTAERTALELTALCSALAVEDLEDEVGGSVVEELEATGLIEVEAVGAELQARLAHPIYAQVLRETMPSLRARRLLLGQVARVEGRGADRHGDVLRIASWRLEATGTADPGLLIDAARLARAGHDYPQIEKLCRAALAAGPNPEVAAMLGEALYEDGRFAEADDAFAEAVRTAPASDAARFVLSRAYNLFFGLGRLDQALGQLDDAPGSATPGAADLTALRALLLTQGGRTAAALDVLAGMDAASSPELAGRARSLALWRTGRLEEAASLAQGEWDRSPDTGQLLHPAGSLMVLALARASAGDLRGAAAAAELGAHAASRQGVEFQALWLRWVQALVARAEGDLVTATERATEVLATATTAGLAAPARLAAATLATVAAERGAAGEAMAAVARLEDLTAPPELYDVWVQVALGWADLSLGRRDEALRRWSDSAGHYLEHGELLAATDVLHEAVRVGDATAASRLIDLAGQVSGDLSEARVQHARGIAGEPAALVAAADRFADLGLHLLAAEAATAAVANGTLPRRDRARVAALAASERALCSGAATPALAGRPASGGLTTRESEIARLAAGGHTSKEIAESLVLSVRTVDNHLQNVYAKLGVGGRDQLATALGWRDLEGEAT